VVVAVRSRVAAVRAPAVVAVAVSVPVVAVVRAPGAVAAASVPAAAVADRDPVVVAAASVPVGAVVAADRSLVAAAAVRNSTRKDSREPDLVSGSFFQGRKQKAEG